MLTEKELAFLRVVKARQGTGDPVQPLTPIGNRIQSLIDRGYLRTSRLILPCLNCYSDDVCVRVTEAGELAMKEAPSA